MNIEKPAKGYITQYFNTPVDYIAGRSYHEALDIVNDNFTNIYSMFDGYVILVVDDVPDYAQTSPTNYSGYGNEVWIVSNNGKVKQRVAHLKKGAKVKEGQKVKQDTVIGVMGQTGYRFPLPTIHTHYEIYVDNVRVDPLGDWQKYLKDNNYTMTELEKQVAKNTADIEILKGKQKKTKKNVKKLRKYSFLKDSKLAKKLGIKKPKKK